MKPEQPKDIPGVRKSSRVKIQKKQDYIPIMTGSKYGVPVYQLEDNRALHPNAHMLCMKIQQEQPHVITANITQLSLKPGLK